MFSDKHVITRRLVKVAGNALCRGETKEGLKQWVCVLEIQKLGQEGDESRFGKASSMTGTSKGASGVVGRGVDTASMGRLAQ